MSSSEEPFDYFRSKDTPPKFTEAQVLAYSEGFKDLLRRGCLLEHTWRTYLLARGQEETADGPYGALGLNLTNDLSLRLVIRHEGRAVMEVNWPPFAEAPQVLVAPEAQELGHHELPIVAQHLSEEDLLAYQLTAAEAAYQWVRITERKERMGEVWMALVNQWTQEGYAHYERWSVGLLFDLQGNLKMPIFNSTGASIGSLVYTAYGRDYRLFKGEGYEAPPQAKG